MKSNIILPVPMLDEPRYQSDNIPVGKVAPDVGNGEMRESTKNSDQTPQLRGGTLAMGNSSASGSTGLRRYPRPKKPQSKLQAPDASVLESTWKAAGARPARNPLMKTFLVTLWRREGICHAMDVIYREVEARCAEVAMEKAEMVESYRFRAICASEVQKTPAVILKDI